MELEGAWAAPKVKPTGRRKHPKRRSPHRSPHRSQQGSQQPVTTITPRLGDVEQSGRSANAVLSSSRCVHPSFPSFGALRYNNMFAVSVASQMRCWLGFESTSGVIAIRAAMAMNPQGAVREIRTQIASSPPSAFLFGNLLTQILTNSN